MEDFFERAKYRRHHGEHVTDWLTRWDDGVRKMDEENMTRGVAQQSLCEKAQRLHGDHHNE